MYAVMALRESRENPTIPVARDSWCQRLKSVSVASAMRMLKLLAGIVELVGRKAWSACQTALGCFATSGIQEGVIKVGNTANLMYQVLTLICPG